MAVGPRDSAKKLEGQNRFDGNGNSRPNKHNALSKSRVGNVSRNRPSSNNEFLASRIASVSKRNTISKTMFSRGYFEIPFV